MEQRELNINRKVHCGHHKTQKGSLHSTAFYVCKYLYWFFLNGPALASFSFIFGLFKQTLLQILQQINVNKYHARPVYGAWI